VVQFLTFSDFQLSIGQIQTILTLKNLIPGRDEFLKYKINLYNIATSNAKVAPNLVQLGAGSVRQKGGDY